MEPKKKKINQRGCEGETKITEEKFKIKAKDRNIQKNTQLILQQFKNR